MLSSKLVDEMNLLFAQELELARTEKAKKKSGPWSCPIKVTKLDKYVIVPLVSSKKVKSEGYKMQNCVREYITQCQGGSYLLFSILNEEGIRVATLGAIRRDDRWDFDECLGRKNSEVLETQLEYSDVDGFHIVELEYTEIFSVAHEVIRLLNCKKRPQRY